MNNTGFVRESMVAVRKQASHASEMVNQLFFGELVRIINQQTYWTYIRSLEDQYEGWVSANMVEPVSEAFLSENQPFVFVNAVTAPLHVDRPVETSVVNLCQGARFPVFPPDNEDWLYFKLSGTTFRLHKRFVDHEQPQQADAIIETARRYMNVPYLWGGRSPFGVDCSGLMQIVFRQHGIRLPRDSYQQATVGTTRSFADRQPGDLVFFKADNGFVIHVGLLTSRERIIHASGRVRLDFITPEGIYNPDTKSLSHKLHSLKTVLP